jgi:hypothetical protein
LPDRRNSNVEHNSTLQGSRLAGGAKTDSAPGLLGRFHQFPDGVENDLKLRAIYAFQFFQAPGQFAVRGQHFPQLYEGANNEHADFDRPPSGQRFVSTVLWGKWNSK